jgi:hypothetical protein
MVAVTVMVMVMVMVMVTVTVPYRTGIVGVGLLANRFFRAHQW